MNDMTEQDAKKATLKLKMQEKQLQVVTALINRSSGYAKTQAEASEARLTEEIASLKEQLKLAPPASKKKTQVKPVKVVKTKVKAAAPATKAKSKASSPAKSKAKAASKKSK